MLNQIQTSIQQVESKLLTMKQADCPVIHKFENGFYIRELHMKAGTLAIGHHQNFEHLNIFVKGRVLMRNDDGSTTVLQAPMTFIGKPGRKVGYILEDVVWQNVYQTELKDVELLEAWLLTKSDNFNQDAKHKYAIAYNEKEEDRSDYNKAITEFGYSEEEVQEMVNEEEDQVALPDGCYKVKIAISPIEGLGIIATADIEPDEVIGIARLGFYRTPLGRYTNHAKVPNAKMVPQGDNILLVAIQPIYGAHGGEPGEEVVIDYRETIKMIRG